MDVRGPALALEEPTRAQVLAFRPGDPVDRRVRVVLMDTTTGRASTAFGRTVTRHLWVTRYDSEHH